MAGRDSTRALDEFRPGMRVYVAGSGGEPTALLNAWAADPDRTRELSIVSTAVPGINDFDFDRLDESCIVTGLFMQPAFAGVDRRGRFRQLPTSYAGFVRDLRDARKPFDVAIVQVSPPDARGQCSLGPAVEFMPTVLRSARRIVAVINHGTPAFAGSPSLDIASFDATIETDTPLPTYLPGTPDPQAVRIAALIADFIGDGSIVQMGLGKTPAALCEAIADRRGLRLRAGMYGEGVRRLHQAGALAAGAVHQACVTVGSGDLYDWARHQGDLRLVGCETSHDPAQGNGAMIAVNSALEVDLSGQCALEYMDGRGVSGAGGAPDFARMARLSPGGASIVALPSTGARGQASRIVPRLSDPAVASLPRCDVDVVITEHGAADLRGRSVRERAELLIEIADPGFRASLRESCTASALGF